MTDTTANTIRFAAICLVSIVLLAPVTAMGQAYWVSTTGSDAGAGTRDEPFATPQRARDALREARRGRLPKGGVTVWLKGGVYRMDRTLELDERDSGTAGAPVVYRSAPGEEVRLVGGKQVPSKAFEPVTDPAVLERLEPAAHGKVVQADLKAVGISDYGKLTRRGGIERNTLPAALELFFNDRPMPLARWPNEGWTRIAAVPGGPKGERFHYQGDRPKGWDKTDDIWVHGYFNRNWCDTYENVAAVDTENREIVTREPHDYRGYKAGQRIRFLNLLEELDEPGEWYLERTSGTLYFWPPEPIDTGRICVSLLETPLVVLRGCEHVTLRGLILECTRGSGVEIVGGHHDLVAGCTLRNIGTVAVAVGGVVTDHERRIYNNTMFAGNAGTDNGVISCDIHDTGEYGIILGGGRDNVVENNIFVDCPLAISVDNRGFYGSRDTLFARLKAVSHDRPPYSTRYPALARILDVNPELPVGNIIARNISIRSEFLSLSDGMPEEIQKLVTVTDNLSESNPGLFATEGGEFKLRGDSPALKFGFKPIPFDKIGLYQDEYR